MKKGSLYNEETPFSIAEGRLFNFKIQLPLSPLTTLFYPTNSVHSPLHSERGRGRGCFSTRNKALLVVGRGAKNGGKDGSQTCGEGWGGQEKG